MVADPYPAYRDLHERGGIGRCPARDLWVIAGHEQVQDATRAHAELSSAAGVSEAPGRLPMMLTLDPPDHERLRRIVAPQFTRNAVERWRPRIEEIAGDSIERLIAAPGSDAVAELAVPLPVTVIAELLGIPAADAGRLRAWSDEIVEGFHADRSLASLPRGVRVGRNVLQLYRYMRAVFRERRRAPGDDVLSHLLASRTDGALTEEELFWFVLLLLVAGNETTTNLLGSMLLALAEDPDAYARLRREPALVPAAVEESLRWASPVQGFYRVARARYRAGDEAIPEGARALLLFGAANRDPARYPDPDHFLIDRNPTDHLAFGWGIHYCLGAHLARLEARVVLERLLERVERMELDGDPAWSANPNLRGPVRLPLRLRAA